MDDDSLDLLRIEITTTLPSPAMREDGCPTTSRVAAYWEEGPDEPVARAKLAEFNVIYSGDESDDEHSWLLDGHSQEANDLHWAIREHFAQFDEDIMGFVLLEGLVVDPNQRGKGVGTQILRSLAEHYGRHGGTPSHILLSAHPIENRKKTERGAPSWKERDPKGFAQAQKRLIAFYERHGFERLGKTEFMALDLRRNLPPLEPGAIPG